MRLELWGNKERERREEGVWPGKQGPGALRRPPYVAGSQEGESRQRLHWGA